MATTSASDLLDRAIALARLQRLVHAVTGLLLAALVVAAGLAALLTAAAFTSPLSLRLGVIAMALAAVAAVAVWAAREVLRSPPAARIAGVVERRIPDLRDRFVTAVEIEWSERQPQATWTPSSTCSPALARALAREARELVRGRSLREAVDTGRLRASAVAVAVMAVALAGSALFFPGTWADMLRPPPTDAAATAHVMMRPLRRPSATGPSVADLTLRLEYPAYTQRRAEIRQTELQTISAVVGTRVTLTAKAIGDRAAAQLTLNGATEPLGVRATGDVSTEFVLREDTTWRLRVTDRSGRAMSTPVCRIKAVRDQPPTVSLTEPGKNLALRTPRALRLAYRAEDDWGVRGVSLQYRPPGDGNWQTVPVSAPGGRSVSGVMDWDLAPLRLMKGQTVSYRMAARDNDTVSGPKSSRTPTYTVTIGEQPEQAADSAPARAAVAEEAEGLDELEQEAEKLGRQLDELIAGLEDAQMSGEERARQAAELAEAQRRVAEQADRVSRALAESERQASDDPTVPAEIREKMQELHDLLQEAMNEDLKQALDEIEEALKNLDAEKMRENLERARQSQEEFAARLQQAIELLKRLRLEQEIARAADEAERLAGQQQALNEQRPQLQPEDADGARRQAAEQQALKKREAGLEGDLERLQQKARETDDGAADELEKIAQDLARSGAQQAMQQAADRLQQGDPSAAAQPQNQAFSGLNDAASALRQLQAQMTANSGQQLGRAAQELIRDSLYLSREQERVMQSAGSLDQLTAQSASQGKAERERLRREQETLESGTRQLGQKISNLAQQTPAVDPSLADKAERAADAMAQAARETAGGAGPQAVVTQREAMSRLNELAEDLIRLSQNMQQAAQGMAMQQLLQQLRALAQQQRGLNQQAEQRSDGGSTPRRQGSTSDLADEQARIREGLQRLLERAGKPSGLPDQLGDVPAQMEDVEQQLAGDRLARQTLEQQRDILHRMLDAQRSVYKKDEQRRRRTAERPKPFRLPPSPPELRPRRAAQTGPRVTAEGDELLPLDFEDIVREYFRALAEVP